MACFVSMLLTAPWYVWGWWLSLAGLAVFVLFSAGYFYARDGRDRREGRDAGSWIRE